MFRRSYFALIVLLLVTSLSADDQAKFRADARLVLVPTIVHDKSGNHISGLTKDQFKLTQDGKEQQIGVFEEVKVSKEHLVPVSTPLPEFSNVIKEPKQLHALTVVAFDVMNTPVLSMTQVKEDLLKYLRQLAEIGEPTALVTIEAGRSRVIYDFTTDPRMIAAAVKKLQARTPPGQTSTALGNDQPYLVQNSPEIANISAEQLAVLERQLSTWIHAKINEDNAARIQARQTRRDTLEALRNLAFSLKSFPGRKTLIWVTGGFPYSEDTLQIQESTARGAATDNPRDMRASGGQPNAPGGLNPTQPTANPDGTGISSDYSTPMPSMSRNVPNSEAIADHTKTWGALNDANVAVYPVDARRLVNTSFDNINPDVKNSTRAVDREMNYSKAQEVITTFENMASATGGKPCYGRADLTNCFKDAITDGDSYYLIGYYLPVKTTKAGWHKLQVKTAQKDANLRTRNGFFYSGVAYDDRPAIQEDVMAALNSPMNAVAMPFRGSFLSTTDRNGKKAVQFELRLPFEALTIDDQNGNRMKLDIAAVAFGNDGKVAGKMGQTIDTMLKPEAIAQLQTGGLRYKNLLELDPGEYTVNFVVRDNLTGRVGSVRAPLKVQ